MDLFVVVLRILHVVSALFWFGAAMMTVFFLEPTIEAIGPKAQPFMDHLMNRRHLAAVITVIAALTILAGLVLYWRDSSGLQLVWITSPTGLGFTVGAASAIVAFGIGGTVIGPTVGKLTTLGNEVAASGGPPSPEQAQLLGQLAGRLKAAGQIDAVLLIIAALTMATARYL